MRKWWFFLYFWRNISINRAPHSETEPSQCDHTYMPIQFEGLSLIPDLNVATLVSGVTIKRLSVWTANCCCHMALRSVLNAASTSWLSLPAVRADFSHLRIFDRSAYSHPKHCWPPPHQPIWIRCNTPRATVMIVLLMCAYIIWCVQYWSCIWLVQKVVEVTKCFFKTSFEVQLCWPAVNLDALLLLY